jgi:hypothetical protein
MFDTLLLMQKEMFVLRGDLSSTVDEWDDFREFLHAHVSHMQI